MLRTHSGFQSLKERVMKEIHKLDPAKAGHFNSGYIADCLAQGAINDIPDDLIQKSVAAVMHKLKVTD